MNKVCAKCKKKKPLYKFRNDKYNSDGKKSRCKDCLSTFKPRMVKCWVCPNYFLKTQSNYKFCSPKCHNRCWNRITNASAKRYIYMREYNRMYRKKHAQETI